MTLESLNRFSKRVCQILGNSPPALDRQFSLWKCSEDCLACCSQKTWRIGHIQSICMDEESGKK